MKNRSRGKASLRCILAKKSKASRLVLERDQLREFVVPGGRSSPVGWERLVLGRLGRSGYSSRRFNDGRNRSQRGFHTGQRTRVSTGRGPGEGRPLPATAELFRENP